MGNNSIHAIMEDTIQKIKDQGAARGIEVVEYTPAKILETTIKSPKIIIRLPRGCGQLRTPIMWCGYSKMSKNYVEFVYSLKLRFHNEVTQELLEKVLTSRYNAFAAWVNNSLLKE